MILSNKKIKYFTDYLFPISGLIYFAGYLVINGYYSAFHFASIEVLNARFLLAGIVVTFFLSVCTFISWYVYKRARRNFQLIDINKNKISLPLMLVLVLHELIDAVASIALMVVLISSTLITYIPGAIKNFDNNIVFSRHDFLANIINRMLPRLSDSIRSGIWWQIILTVALVGIPYILFNVAPRIKRRLSKHKTKKPIYGLTTGRIILTIFILSYLPQILWIVLPSSMPNFVISMDNVSEQVLSIAILGKWLFLRIILFTTILACFPKILTKSKDRIAEKVWENMSLLTTTFVGVILISIIDFGNTIYPKIPPELGGIQPKKIQQIYSKDGEKLPDLSNIYLIDVTPKELLLVSEIAGENQKLSINRDQISTIIYR